MAKKKAAQSQQPQLSTFIDTTIACSNERVYRSLFCAARCAFDFFCSLSFSSLHPHSLRNIDKMCTENGSFLPFSVKALLSLWNAARFRCIVLYCGVVSVCCFVFLLLSFIPHFVESVWIFIHNVHACWNCINSQPVYIYEYMVYALHGTFLQNKASQNVAAAHNNNNRKTE